MTDLIKPILKNPTKEEKRKFNYYKKNYNDSVMDDRAFSRMEFFADNSLGVNLKEVESTALFFPDEYIEYELSIIGGDKFNVRIKKGGI